MVCGELAPNLVIFQCLEYVATIVPESIINQVQDGVSIILKYISRTEATEKGWTRECCGIKRGFGSEDKVWVLSGLARCCVSIPLTVELHFYANGIIFARYITEWRGQTSHIYCAKLFAVPQTPHLSKDGNTLAPRNPLSAHHLRLSHFEKPFLRRNS
jgi:hypothetical protein